MGDDSSPDPGSTEAARQGRLAAVKAVMETFKEMLQETRGRIDVDAFLEDSAFLVDPTDRSALVALVQSAWMQYRKKHPSDAEQSHGLSPRKQSPHSDIE